MVKPCISNNFNSRCQVDLVDCQSQPDGDYEYIMVYRDCLTKFIILRPLKSEEAEEVAGKLLDIFLLFGAPSILQYDGGREFCNQVIEDLETKWPGLKIISGKPRQSQSQNSVNSTNQDIEILLSKWMFERQTKNWSRGLGYIQYAKNKAFHKEIQKSPYEALFGQSPKAGLSPSLLPLGLIKQE